VNQNNFKMAKAKKALKMIAVKKKVASFAKEKEPQYTVQINDPGSLRKDLLESLREIIIFMQTYDNFRKIQEEKVATFNQLKMDIKELNLLIDNKLRGRLPRGNLKPVNKKAEMDEMTKEALKQELPVPKPVAAPVSAPKPAPEPMIQNSHNELEELEQQLKDIENQLKGM